MNKKLPFSGVCMYVHTRTKFVSLILLVHVNIGKYARKSHKNFRLD